MSEIDPTIRAAVLRQEQERLGGYSDPATRAAIARADDEARDEGRRAAEATQRRATDARADLLRERERRLLSWMTSGGDIESFDKAWSDIRYGILMERQRRSAAQVTNVFK